METDAPISVAHPLVQHSYELCAGLAERGLLHRFYTGFYSPEYLLNRGPAPIRARLARRWHPGIPSHRVSSLPVHEALYRASRRFFHEPRSSRLLHMYFRAFDSWVARAITESQPRMVVGYEGSCLETFRACRRHGITCVLDAASVHHQTQRSAWPEYPSDELWQRVDRRKSEEVELADHILTLSQFARDTYLAAGVPEDKVSVVSLGIDPRRFPRRKHNQGNKPFRYIFAGALSRIKGVDLLLDAFGDPVFAGKELVLVGPPGDVFVGKNQVPDSVRSTGFLGQGDLLKEYLDADVAVFPSRFDGFGQVVLEAMCTGLPVIVSDHVGAKDFVLPERSGWIFRSGDVGALRRAMLDASSTRSSLQAIGMQASMVAAEQTWDVYRKDVSRRLNSLLERPPARLERCLSLQ